MEPNCNSPKAFPLIIGGPKAMVGAVMQIISGMLKTLTRGDPKNFGGIGYIFNQQRALQ